jgi:hypothetical protein
MKFLSVNFHLQLNEVYRCKNINPNKKNKLNKNVENFNNSGDNIQVSASRTYESGKICGYGAG